jgi:hypothetical protein
MGWLALDDLEIGSDRLGVGLWIFFERDSARKQVSYISRPGVGANGCDRNMRNDLLLGREVKNELPGDGLKQPAFVAEGDAVPGGEGARLKQRIFHAGNLLLHSLQGLPNDRGTDFSSAQVADFFDLQEIEKGIILGGGNQSGFFPTRQLTRREPQNAKQVRSTVSVHGCMQSYCPHYQEAGFVNASGNKDSRNR